MNLTESWSHAVELEGQGGQEAQSLPGWAVGDVLSSTPRCLPGSLRSVQLLLDHLVEMRDRAVCHQRRNGRKAMCLYDGTQWCSVCGEEEWSKNRALGNIYMYLNVYHLYYIQIYIVYKYNIFFLNIYMHVCVCVCVCVCVYLYIHNKYTQHTHILCKQYFYFGCD